MLTIVIGGNHEASNYMWELWASTAFWSLNYFTDRLPIRYHGGWLAPNIYFLGHAGCIQVNGIRIAGASGIFKAHDFRHGTYAAYSYISNYYIHEPITRKSRKDSLWLKLDTQHLSYSRILCPKTFPRMFLYSTSTPMSILPTAVFTPNISFPWLATIYRALWWSSRPSSSEEIPPSRHRVWNLGITPSDGFAKHTKARLVVLCTSSRSLRGNSRPWGSTNSAQSTSGSSHSKPRWNHNRGWRPRRGTTN